MNPRDTECAWAAGFLDGEGCFTLVKHSKTRDPTGRALHISASQTTLEPLLKLQELFGGKIRPCSRPTAKGTPIHTWVLGQKTEVVQEFIPIVLPYLIVRRRQAEILLAFSKTIKYRGRITGSISSDDLAIRELLIAELEVIRGR